MNAKDVFEIDRFDQTDTKKVTITRADNEKYYKHFYHVMSHQWQEEVIGAILFESFQILNRAGAAFDQIVSHADAAEARHTAKLLTNKSPVDGM